MRVCSLPLFCVTIILHENTVARNIFQLIPVTVSQSVKLERIFADYKVRFVCRELHAVTSFLMPSQGDSDVLWEILT